MDLARLLERRDDRQEWAVYADWLQTRGDPRGALMSLMLSREASPTPALADAVKSQSRLFTELTPDALQTLETRGAPRLAPVFRRGFIWSAGAQEDSDFEALSTHPHCAMVDRALLHPQSVEQLTSWLESLRTPAPWRSVELEVDATQTALPLPLLFQRAPRLEHLALTGRGLTLATKWEGAHTLRHLSLVNPAPAFAALVPLASLRRLDILAEYTSYGARVGTPDLDAVLEMLRGWNGLEHLLLAGRVGPRTRAALIAPKKPQHFAVRSVDPNEPHTRHLVEPLETSFAVFNRPLTQADDAALTQFAKLAGVRRLEARRATWGRASLLELRGDGDAPLVPRVAAQQLAKKDRRLDALALSVSGSNNAVSAWSFGPHVAKADLARDVLPLSRRESAHYQRAQTTRELLEALLGIDPGLDALDEVRDALDLGAASMLVGEAPDAATRLRLFTDLEAQPEQEERDEYDEESEDALDQEYEDDEPDYGEDFVPDPHGAEPINVPDYGPAPEPAPPTAAPLSAKADAPDDDPEDDLEPPARDAYEPDAEEVWTQGPVDLPEHHRGPIGETFDDAEAEERDWVPAGAAPGELATCQHCHQPRELLRCSVCREDVCAVCAGPKSAEAWDDGREFSCAQCTPRTGRSFAVSRVRPRK
ncbi:MAG: hypothetical protein U0228_09415 [Myxococcaceae bacterium]